MSLPAGGGDAVSHPPSSGSPLTLDSASMLKQPFEGQLSKFTNVVKGWQYRWFVLNPETGQLDYYLPEDRKGGAGIIGSRNARPPRGSQHLAGALVMPSDEDDKCFGINFSTGEVYKLRAANVRERQVWVDRVRAVAQAHDRALAQNSLPIGSYQNIPPTPPGAKSHISGGEPSTELQHLSLSILDAFGSVHDIIHQSEVKADELCKTIEKFPSNGDRLRCTDRDLLLLKATSNAAIKSLEEGLSILQDYREIIHGPVSATTPISKSIWSSHASSASPKKVLASPSPSAASKSIVQNTSLSSSGPSSISKDLRKGESSIPEEAARL